MLTTTLTKVNYEEDLNRNSEIEFLTRKKTESMKLNTGLSKSLGQRSKKKQE